MAEACRTPDFEVATDWLLEAEPEELAAIVLDPELIHLWCSNVFLDSELVDRGRGDGLGLTIRLYTKGFLPHSFFFEARIVDGVPHRSMVIAVTGDFDGLGRLSVVPLGDGRCAAHLHWRISVRHPYVRHFVRALHPIFVWNHKWAMRNARRLLQAEVFRRREGSVRFVEARPTFPHNIGLYRRWQRRRAAARCWHGTEGLETDPPG